MGGLHSGHDPDDRGQQLPGHLLFGDQTPGTADGLGQSLHRSLCRKHLDSGCQATSGHHLPHANQLHGGSCLKFCLKGLFFSRRLAGIETIPLFC